MARYFSLLRQYFFQYAKVRLGYRGDFLLSVVTTLISTLFGIAVVLLLFRRVPVLHGWAFNELLFLYGYSLLPMSLFNMLSINLYYFADQYLVQGKFDRVLLRPLHPLFQILFEQFRLEALGEFALGVAVLVYTVPRLAHVFVWTEWLYLAGAVVCGAVLYLAVFICLTSISFWMEDRVGVMPPVYNLITFGRYPLDIYNGAVRFLLSWVVPFGFATFYPTAGVLRASVYRTEAYLLPVVTAVFVGLAVTLFGRGVQRYGSTGS